MACSVEYALHARETARLVRFRPACEKRQQTLAKDGTGGRIRRGFFSARRPPPPPAEASAEKAKVDHLRRPHPSTSAPCADLPSTPQPLVCPRCDRAKEETRGRARAAPGERLERDERRRPIARRGRERERGSSSAPLSTSQSWPLCCSWPTRKSFRRRSACAYHLGVAAFF